MKFEKRYLLANILCVLVLISCGKSVHAKSPAGSKPPVKSVTSCTNVIKQGQICDGVKWKTMESSPYLISFPIAEESDWNSASVLKSEDGGMTQHIVNKIFGLLDGKFVRSFFFAVLDFDNMNCNKSEDYMKDIASSYGAVVQSYSSEDAKKTAKYIVANTVTHIEGSTTIKGYITVNDIQKCFAFELGQITSDLENFKSLDLREQSKFGQIVRDTIFGVNIKN